MTARRAPVCILGCKVPAPFTRVQPLALLVVLALAPLHALAREPTFCSVPIEALRAELLAALPRSSWSALPPAVKRWGDPNALVLELFQSDGTRSRSRDAGIDRSLAFMAAVASLGLAPDIHFSFRFQSTPAQVRPHITLIFMSETELRNARRVSLSSDMSGDRHCTAVIRSPAGDGDRIAKGFVLMHESAPPVEVERCARIGLVRVLGLLRWNPQDRDVSDMAKARLFLRSLYSKDLSSSPVGLDDLGHVLRKEYDLACR